MTNILNEDLKSKFLQKINKKIQDDYKKDNDLQKNFINDITLLIKELYDYNINNKNDSAVKSKFHDLKDKIDVMKDDYDLSSTLPDKLKSFIGADYYGYYAKETSEINSYFVDSLKDYLKSQFSDRSSYTKSGRCDIRSHGTSSNNKNTNSFKFISEILNRTWGKDFDIANITDEYITKVQKVPKLITERSPLYGKFLFWFSSKDPDSNELLDDDVLKGISRADSVYFPYANMHRGRYETLKIKDLADISNKVFSIDQPDEVKNKNNVLRREREDNKGILRYEEYTSKPYSEPVEVDEFPDANDKNSPSYVKMNGKIYHKTTVNNVFSNNEFIRDAEYKEYIANQLQRYKTIIERNKINNLDNSFDNAVKNIIERTHQYLGKMTKYKTSDLRNIYNKLDKMLSDYEQYLHHKKELTNSYSTYHKEYMVEYRNNTMKRINELLELIEKGTN